MGLGYLSLNRKTNSLSGGESQRISLSTSLGSSLVGSMYILDEPSLDCILAIMKIDFSDETIKRYWKYFGSCRT